MNKVEFFRSVRFATLVCMLVRGIMADRSVGPAAGGAQTTAANRAIALAYAGTIR